MDNRKPRRLLLLCLLTILAAPRRAAAEIDTPTELTLQISTRPEAKLILTQSFIFPVLRGTGPLTKGNSLKTALNLELSPISLNGTADIIWTPIAFFQVIGGGWLGTGWNHALGNGIGVNTPGEQSGSEPRTSEIAGEPFGGMYWGVQAGGVLQFDLAAVFPGDWNHVVMVSQHEWRYRAFTDADDGGAWVFESDSAENQNGFSYYGNLLVGYQMPASPILEMVGFLAEANLNLYGVDGEEQWGDHLPRWHFGILFNLVFSERFSLAVLTQMRTRWNYGTSDLENKEHNYYQDQTLNSDDPYRLVFYRVAAILNFKLR